jgi:NADH-quinone oxidoreductase subunit N
VSIIFGLAIPEIILVAGACVLFLGATFRIGRSWWAGTALVAICLSGQALACQSTKPFSGDAGPLIFDSFALFVKTLAVVGGAIVVLFSWNEVPDRQAAEYHACVLLMVAGTCLTGAANELITLFLALELVSIPTYVLLYLPRHDNAAQEAAMKYFMLSVFTSALSLFGFSYLYGIAGTTILPDIQNTLRSLGGNSTQGLVDTTDQQTLPLVALAALTLVVAGLGFRITAVPFHFYAPDVYQGTPTIGAGLLAFVPKVAGFVALFRVLGFVGDIPSASGWALDGRVSMIFYSLAIATMTLGNVLGLLQDNIKRLLAYSSVAHAGYMLIGLTVAPNLADDSSIGGADAVLFYLVAYSAMTVGAFGVIAYLSGPDRPVETVDDFAGLGASRPGIALLMAVFLLSLIGIPLTAGFAGKLLLFYGALSVQAADHPWLFTSLALLGVINSAIGAWYYLRILAVMYFRTALRPLEPRQSLPGLATLWICAAATLVFGIYPQPLSRAARGAIARASSTELRAKDTRTQMPALLATAK